MDAIKCMKERYELFDRIRRFSRSHRLKRKRKYTHPQPRHNSRCRNRGYALHEMDNISDAQFHRMFRLSRLTFSALLELLSPFIERIPKAPKSYGGLISTKTRLAVTLRWLAGGSYQDICFALLQSWK